MEPSVGDRAIGAVDHTPRLTRPEMIFRVPNEKTKFKNPEARAEEKK